MSKKTSRRKATTLIELIVVLVMMGFFIMMVFNMFNVTYDAYNFNREIAAKSYAQANVDNFFEILEKELMYSGSLGAVIKKLEDYDQNKSINIEESTITVQYALAEQLILTKKDIDNYDLVSPTLTTDERKFTYFALYPAFIPEETENRWVLAYDDIFSTNEATVLQIASIDSTPVTVGTETITKFKVNDPNITNPATYISILLYEKAFNSLEESKRGIKIDDDASWTGEMIYKTTIGLKSPNEPKESTKLTVKKYIPTVNSEYEIALMDNILDFKATETNELYIATVSYLVPGIYRGFLKKGTEEASVNVTRKFLKTQ